METNTSHRNKAISVKMSEKVFNDFVALARSKDLLPSTMAYLVIRQYVESKLDSGYETITDDLL